MIADSFSKIRHLRAVDTYVAHTRRTLCFYRLKFWRLPSLPFGSMGLITQRDYLPAGFFCVMT